MTKAHERRMQLRKERMDAGLCAYCGKAPRPPTGIGCPPCAKKQSNANGKFSRDNTERTTLYRRRLRQKVINKYGGKCTCCAETEMLFLTVDHINGDGQKDRVGGGTSSWYMKLLREPVRNDLQVLCYNCNIGREVNGGVCPHTRPTPDLYTEDLRATPRFNKGVRYNWPTDEELTRLYLELGCTKVGQMLGVPADTVIKRLKRRGIAPRRSQPSVTYARIGSDYDRAFAASEALAGENE